MKRIVILGGSFAGLSAAYHTKAVVGDEHKVTVIERYDYMLFRPNIPLFVLEGKDPRSLHLQLREGLEGKGIEFVQAEVREIDPDKNVVRIRHEEGDPVEEVPYDYLVIALGANHDFASIPGYEQFGNTICTDYTALKLMKRLKAFKGGKIVIGAQKFKQGTKVKVPHAEAACEGPPVEFAFALDAYLKEHHITAEFHVFTPGEVIAEDAGIPNVEAVLKLATERNFHYHNKMGAITELTEQTVRYENGQSLEYDLAIIFPNWKGHDVVARTPLVDEAGFVVTDEKSLRHPKYQNVYSCGDAAAVTVPKLGHLGMIGGRTIASEIGHEMGLEDDVIPFSPEVLCIMDLGYGKAAYLHSNTWWGGKISKLSVGRIPYYMKVGFKDAYFLTHGNIPETMMNLFEGN